MYDTIEGNVQRSTREVYLAIMSLLGGYIFSNST